MSRAVIAVLLSALVWPGAGQLYNRDFRKGILLFAISFLLCLSFIIGAEMQILKELGGTLDNIDLARVREAIQAVLKKNTPYVSTFNTLMLVSWIYGVLDAYWGAREKSAAAPVNNDETPSTPDPDNPDKND